MVPTKQPARVVAEAPLVRVAAAGGGSRRGQSRVRHHHLRTAKRWLSSAAKADAARACRRRQGGFSNRRVGGTLLSGKTAAACMPSHSFSRAKRRITQVSIAAWSHLGKPDVKRGARHNTVLMLNHHDVQGTAVIQGRQKPRPGVAGGGRGGVEEKGWVG